MSDTVKRPERHALMSAGRVAFEHPWYDAEEADAIFNEQAKTIERLTEGIKGALQQAGNRWDEWGTRALSVADILDATLKEGE